MMSEKEEDKVYENQTEQFCFFSPSTKLTKQNVNLTRLLIVGQTLDSYEGIEKLVHLTELWLTECKLKIVPNIWSCSNLEKLYLYSNELETLPDISKLPKLTVFWFSNNRVTELKNIEKCYKLKDLNMANNKVKSFDHYLSKMGYLQKLNASGNPIRNLKVVTQLKSLSSLKTLMFADPVYRLTPIVTVINYRCFVIYTLPQLKNLDYFRIDEAELKNSQEYFKSKTSYYSMKFHKLIRDNYYCMAKKIKGYQLELESLKERIYFSVLNENQAKSRGLPEQVEKYKWEQKHLDNELLRWETSYSQYDRNEDKKLEVNIKILDLELKYTGNVIFQVYDSKSELLQICQKLMDSFTCSYTNKEASVESVKVDRVIHVINRLRESFEELQMMKKFLLNIEKQGFYLMLDPVCVQNENELPFEFLSDYFNQTRTVGEQCSVTNCVAAADSGWLNCNEIHRKIFLTNDKKCGKRLGVIVYAQPDMLIKKYGSEDSSKYHVNSSGIIVESSDCEIFSVGFSYLTPFFLVEYHYNYQDLMKDFELILQGEVPVEKLSVPILEFCQMKQCNSLEYTNWNTLKDLTLSKSFLTSLGLPRGTVFPILKNLDISYNKLVTMKEICEVFPNLESLNMSFNDLTSLKTIKKCDMLEKLNVSWNNLNELIPNLILIKSNAPQLRHLDMSYNCFEDIHFSNHILYFVKKFLPFLKKFNSDWMRTVEINIIKTFEGIYDLPVIEKTDEELHVDPLGLKWKGIYHCIKGTKVDGSHATVNKKRHVICLVFIGGKEFHKFKLSLELSHLKWLTISLNTLNNLEFLTSLKYLEEANFSKNALRSLGTVFNSMSRLVRLDLSCNYLTSLEELKTANLKSLKILNVSMNKLESLRGVESLTELEELYAPLNRLNKIENIYSIKGLQKLLIIDLTNNKVEDSQDLRNFLVYHLKSIEFINGVGVKDLEVLEASISQSGTVDTDYLLKLHKISALHSITELSITRGSIKKVSLDGSILQNIVSLNMDGNNLTCFYGFSVLKKLKFMCLSNNQINRFAEHESSHHNSSITFESLEVFHLNGNAISDIEPLELQRVPNLRSLFLQDNHLVSLSGLQKLKNLEHLVLDRNRIRHILPRELHGLNSLMEIYLESNQLEDLEFLLYMPKLKKLFLGYNKIYDSGALQYLSALQWLSELTLYGNPVYNSSNIFKFLFQSIPNLRNLNGFPL